MSGGYSTLDFAAAHFGLGDFTKIAKIEVDWSTGGTSVLEGNFSTGYKYLIERPAKTIN